MFISDYEVIQDRTIQAAEAFLSEQPALGRVDQSVVLLISRDVNAKSWLEDYQTRNPQGRSIVAFNPQSLRHSTNDSWYVRNEISHFLYRRDLFDYQLPVNKDQFFFGRNDMIQDYIDAIRKSQNRGLFGLRKTGKTSTLLKIQRQCKDNNIADVFYYDCKFPAIRDLGWESFLKRIISDLASQEDIEAVDSSLHVSDQFLSLVLSRAAKGMKPCCIIFDEIEYISPFSKQNPHWQMDFISLWQTFWSVQSQVRCISYIIAGVNPSISEKDRFYGIQNPIFGIVKPFFIKSFTELETRSMVRTLGRRMGLKFQLDAIAYLHERYGGHPLLIRLACSYTHYNVDRTKRPADVELGFLVRNESAREAELMPYGRHVVAEIEEFYPDEYELLQLLSLGSISDFWELASYQDYVRHISAYGIIDLRQDAIPKFRIPMLQKYIAIEASSTAINSAELNYNDVQLRNRLQRIVVACRDLEILRREHARPPLFGQGTVPEADKIILLSVANNHESYIQFLFQFYRSFVETLWGKKGSRISDMPDLELVVDRIRLLRHKEGHLELYPDVKIQLDDVERAIATLHPQKRSVTFADKQKYLVENLFVALQVEIQKLS